MDPIEQAVALFDDDHNCAQSVLMTYAPEYGLDADIARRIAATFGGGIASQGDTCGAVTGALMVIGLRYGDKSKDELKEIADSFLARFRALHGTTVCRELIDLDIRIAEELEAAREQGIFATRCPQFVRDAAEIVADLQ